MRSRRGWVSLGMALGLIGWGAWGAEPDPEEVRRRMEIYMREEKPAPAQKPVSKPAPKPAPAVDHDREAWQSAERCGTAACFQAYLEEYPKGRYTKMARARLEPKSESRPVTTERSTPPPRPAETLLANRYRDNSDGTVTDVKTGLQWMRCSLGQTWQGGTCVGGIDKYPWQAALDAAEALNRQGGYAGYRDWRVPAIEELRTLVYCSSGQPKTWNDTGNACEGDYKRPTLYQPSFPNTPNWFFWSASPSASVASGAWGVVFYDGDDGADGRGFNVAVRLVRGGQ